MQMKTEMFEIRQTINELDGKTNVLLEKEKRSSTINIHTESLDEYKTFKENFKDAECRRKVLSKSSIHDVF